MHATCPAHLILFGLISLIHCKEYKLQSSLLCIKRIVFMDFIHRLVSQEQKIKKLKIIYKTLRF
jgi:hypothetical protein